MPKSKKYYAYSAGKKSGVADSWQECQKIVSGVAGAKYKGFESKEEAERWLEAGANYKIKHLAREAGIYFDAGTGAGNGVEISVADKNGRTLLHNVLDENRINERGFHLLGREATNNFGELLALKYALEIAIKDGVQKVFGDSRLVIEFWSKGFIKKNLPEATIELAEHVKKLRIKFEEGGGEVVLISGASNPADLGFHK